MRTPGRGLLHRPKGGVGAAREVGMSTRPPESASPGHPSTSVRLDVLKVIARGVTSGIALHETIEVALDLAARRFPKDALAYLVNAGNREFVVAYATEPPGLPRLRGLTLPVDQCQDLLEVLRSGEPVLVSDAREDDRVLACRQEILTAGCAAFLWMPLVHSGTLAGLLALFSPGGRAWTDAEKGVLSELADYLSMALKDSHSRAERERAEASLRESQEQFRQIAENIREVFWLSDVEKRRLFYVSPRYQEVWGRPLTGLQTASVSWWDAVHPADRERIVAAAHRKQASGEYDEVYRIVHEDGSIRWIHERAFPVHDEKGRVHRIAGLAEDITERRQAEESSREQSERLRMAQKMEAVGQLAGGVAHDFNNILVAILGFSELVRDSLPPGNAQRKNVEEVIKAGERAADLTRQLLAFSRRQVIAPVVLDPNEKLRSIERLLRRVIGEDIELALHLDPGIGRVRADPTQLEQVVMNLAVNARDAMPKGGALIIETADAELGDAFARANPGSRAGLQVMLAVSDTGMGMTRETQARIFEPFFTTKGEGKGTGLGLATVYGIVKQSGWYISVYSEPGKGTTFKVFMPRSDEAPAPVPELGAEGESLGGSETILVVEDDPAVRDLVVAALRGYGYRVLEAREPEDAFVIVEASKVPVHLLLTDVVMPRLSGPDVAKRVRELRPGIAVLFMSGYTDRVMSLQGLDPAISFLQKPFSPRVLASKVREVLKTGGL